MFGNHSCAIVTGESAGLINFTGLSEFALFESAPVLSAWLVVEPPAEQLVAALSVAPEPEPAVAVVAALDAALLEPPFVGWLAAAPFAVPQPVAVSAVLARVAVPEPEPAAAVVAALDELFLSRSLLGRLLLRLFAVPQPVAVPAVLCVCCCA